MPIKQWHNNDLLTDPQRLQMARGESFPVSWNMTAILDEDDTVTAPVVTVTRIEPRPIVDVSADVVSGSASVEGAIVIQTIAGDDLVRGALYEIVVTFTANVGKTVSVMTMLECIA